MLLSPSKRSDAGILTVMGNRNLLRPSTSCHLIRPSTHSHSKHMLTTHPNIHPFTLDEGWTKVEKSETEWYSPMPSIHSLNESRKQMQIVDWVLQWHKYFRNGYAEVPHSNMLKYDTRQFKNQWVLIGAKGWIWGVHTRNLRHVTMVVVVVVTLRTLLQLLSQNSFVPHFNAPEKVVCQTT